MTFVHSKSPPKLFGGESAGRRAASDVEEALFEKDINPVLGYYTSGQLCNDDILANIQCDDFCVCICMSVCQPLSTRQSNMGSFKKASDVDVDGGCKPCCVWLGNRVRQC